MAKIKFGEIQKTKIVEIRDEWVAAALSADDTISTPSITARARGFDPAASTFEQTLRSEIESLRNRKAYV